MPLYRPGSRNEHCISFDPGEGSAGTNILSVATDQLLCIRNVLGQCCTEQVKDQGLSALCNMQGRPLSQSLEAQEAESYCLGWNFEKIPKLTGLHRPCYGAKATELN